MQLPSWVIDKVTKQQTKKAKKPKTRDDKGMVVLLKYVQGSSEKLQKCSKTTASRLDSDPTWLFRKSLVHPKDKRETTETTGCVYELSSKNCDFTYVGEIGGQHSC